MDPAPSTMLQWLATGLANIEWADKEETTVKVEGDVVKELNAVARAVAKAVRPALVGVLPVEQAQVVQWQSWATDATDVFAAAVELNTFLEGRSFLVGTAPTLADIQVYWGLAPGVELTFPGPLATPSGSAPTTGDKGNKENQQQGGGKQQKKKGDKAAGKGTPDPTVEGVAPAPAPAAAAAAAAAAVENPNALDIR
eukprot:evm.model.NODE_31407_length_6906_cov_18.941210.1